MGEKIFIQQNREEILNIIEALNFYKDNAIKPKFKDKINIQIENIVAQAQVQNISVLVDKVKTKFNFGDIVRYEGVEAIIIGMANEEDFIKIAIINDNKFEAIDVPIVLIEK